MSSATPPAHKIAPEISDAAAYLSSFTRGSARVQKEMKKASPPRRGMGCVLTFRFPSGVSIAPTVRDRVIVRGVSKKESKKEKKTIEKKE